MAAQWYEVTTYFTIEGFNGRCQGKRLGLKAAKQQLADNREWCEQGKRTVTGEEIKPISKPLPR